MNKFAVLLFTLFSGFFVSVKADLPGDKLPVPPVVQPIVGQEGKWLSVILPAFTGGGSVYLDYTLRRFLGSPHNDPSVTMPEGISFAPSLCNLYGRPKKAGKYTFTYAAKASSGQVGMVTLTLIIKPNLMPVAPSVRHQEVKVGQSFAIQLPEFTDPENTSLTYSGGFLASDGTGSMTTPSWIVFDPGTRTLVGIPPASTGPGLLAYYQATDEQGKSNDREHDPLSYGLTYSENETAYNKLPDGLHFDPSTRKISGIPTRAGAYKMHYTAKQQGKSESFIDFSLVVEANAMPVAPGIQSQVLEPGKPFSFQFPKFTDPENDPLTHVLDLGINVSSTTDFFPSWMHFDPNTRTVSGTPSQYEESFLLSYRARDAVNESAVQFKVTVRKNKAPVAPTVKNVTYQVNKPMKVHLPVFVDFDHDPVTLTLVGSNYQLPDGIRFKPADREISGTPQKTGVYTLHYIGKDSQRIRRNTPRVDCNGFG